MVLLWTLPSGNILGMDKLLAYLKPMSPMARMDFVTRCKTTEAYLRKAISVKQPLGEGLCLRISAESAGAVMPEDLRPDLDWGYLRKALAVTALPELAQAPANSEPVATETVAHGVA